MTSLKAITLSFFMWVGTTIFAAESPAPTGGANGHGRIVVLGDSITAGYGLDPAEAYPARLQEKVNAAGWKYEVVNAGVSGDTTSGGLRRVDWALTRGADVLIVALGGNDGLRGIQPTQTAANLAGIVQRARAKVPGLEIVIAGMQMPPNMGAEFVEKFRNAFSRVATDSKSSLIPFLLEGVGGKAELNQDDAIHPTAEGQQRVAENVWKVLEPILRHRQSTVAH